MPFVKISYGSSSNISVQGTDYFEVDPEELDGEGNVPESVIGTIWQEAVNTFMEDTAAEVVENEGD